MLTLPNTLLTLPGTEVTLGDEFLNTLNSPVASSRITSSRAQFSPVSGADGSVVMQSETERKEKKLLENL